MSPTPAQLQKRARLPAVLRQAVEFYERNSGQINSVAKWGARALALLFLLLAFAKAWGDGFLYHALDGIPVLGFEADAEPGSDDEAMYIRASVLLLAFVGVQLFVFTLPPPPPRRRETEGLFKED
jgi:hypothetical protein